MLIEVGAPCSLPLGLIRATGAGDEGLHLLGITLQHPPVDVFAQASSRCGVTGPRADLGYEQAQRFLQRHGLELRTEVEIELAIPHLMGLGSEAILGLAVARALAWVYGLRLDDTAALAQAVGLGPRHALEIWGFDQGGCLLVGTAPTYGTAPTDGAALPSVLRRQPVYHRDDEKAWAFVFHLPKVPPDTPQTLEVDRMSAWLSAAPHLSPETGRVLEAELWPALEGDDLAAFARSLTTLQQLNQEALDCAGLASPLTAAEQAVLELMRANGALACGRSPTGLLLWGLVEGASVSIDLRSKLSEHTGFYGGVVMATIGDNDGARHILREMRPIV